MAIVPHQKNLKRAKHIAQRLKLREVVPEPTPATALELFQAEQYIEQEDSILFMEHFRHGDMADFIQKCVNKDIDVGPKHLWKIFSCRKMPQYYPLHDE